MVKDTSETKGYIRWGIVGTGTVAGQFASQFPAVARATAYAVSSRSRSRAETFAREHKLETAHEGVDALCADPAVDVVYVATPTHTHEDIGRVVLDAGKGLVCEKPFGRTRAEAKTLIDQAREANLFCMEAMWMRFNPLVQQMSQAVQTRKVGDVRTVTASLGYRKDPTSLGHAEDGRGALLAFGCYGLSLALHLFGVPLEVQWTWTSNPQGGDETAMLTLRYESHLMTFACSEGATLTNDVRIQGTDGHLHLNDPFIDATALDVLTLSELQHRSIWKRLQGRIQRAIGPILGPPSAGKKRETTKRFSGFREEIREVTDCLRSGKVESGVMPWADTLLVHDILDAAIASPFGTWTSDTSTTADP